MNNSNPQNNKGIEENRYLNLLNYVTRKNSEKETVKNKSCKTHIFKNNGGIKWTSLEVGPNI